ncbi:class F sortase [Actinokineospora bangkokensis]|uniref:Class F sortase n=1 Tax=Actinokineospora bangkokensis TaxID=1193682 RepID=A0A1Q9LN57_9PSEU|nr:class F sortase [Actinokineospora bangkokensis]OLR93460.1 class F sortase [Actinokineospora bangkokensis]
MTRRPLLGLLTLLAAALVACSPAEPAPQSAPQQAQVSAPSAPVTPLWIDVPSIAARSTLVQLGLNADRTVEVPPVDQPMQAGWYRDSPAPGEAGPAVVLGHVDGNRKPGIFWRLKDVAVGDRVEVGRADGSTVAFTVYKVDQVAKDTFPTDAVYGDTDRPEIRLITCGGKFDAANHSYLDNVLVYGSLAA